ncbi:hypothetical protein QQX98_011883 [Neonectria punicea]|uniref:Ankyrin n=1 Tax=Neonectria punicea TaxID=979145 RepID=A0ABR1GKQ4_9HYPO
MDPGKVQLHYIFPEWFLKYIARLRVTAHVTLVPLYVCITTPAVRQEPAAIFDAIKARNITATQRLLLSGDASIYDVSSQPVEMIIDDILINNSIAGTPVGDLSSHVLADVRSAFRLSVEDLDGSYRDCKGLSHLHEVLLGIDQHHSTLSECLACGEITWESINTADRRGRTPVIWAAEFGHANALRLFLQAGADPSQCGPAVCRFQPLLTLAISSPAAQRGDVPALDSIRMLLQANADINAKDGSGRAVVHMAAAKKNILVLRIIEQHAGRKVDWRALTPKGESVVDIAQLISTPCGFLTFVQDLWTTEGCEDVFWDAVEDGSIYR